MSLSTETPAHHGMWRRTAMAAVLLAGTALGGFAVGHAGFAATEATPGAPVNPPGSGMTGHTLPDFTDLVTQVKPAVVSITTRLQADASGDEDQAADAVAVPAVPVRRHGAADGTAKARDRGTWFRLHHRCEWHDRHQQSRGEGRQDRVRHAGRWHEASGQGDRARRAHRHRGAQGRCEASSFPTSSSAIRRT